MDQVTSGAAAPAFDVSLFEAADTGILEVRNQNDGPLLFNGEPVTIELYGPGSEQYAKAEARIATASQSRAFAAMRGKAPKDAASEARKDQIEKLIACTKALNNFPIPGGAAELYANRKLGYITNQVSRFMEDWGNFLSPAARS